MGRPKNPFKKCSKCGIEISRERKNTYCLDCNRVTMRFNNYFNKTALVSNHYNNTMRCHLHEFVDRLIARKEMASMEEIFVEMITLHNHFVKHKDTTRDETPQTQIPRMWQNLKVISEKLKTMK